MYIKLNINILVIFIIKNKYNIKMFININLLKQTLSLDSKVAREQKLIKLWSNKTCSKLV